MMKFSDLSAPAAPKAQSFSRPQKTSEVPTHSKKAAAFSDSHSARDWTRVPDDINFSSFSGGSAVDLPPWCHDMTSLPSEYHLILGYFKNQEALQKSSVIAFL